MLLLHHRGARNVIERVNPLAYQDLGDGTVALFGLEGWSADEPGWYDNVRANPEVKVEIGPDSFEAVAQVAEGDERERIWEKQKRVMPGFADYEIRTARPIPVFILKLRGAPSSPVG